VVRADAVVLSEIVVQNDGPTGRPKICLSYNNLIRMDVILSDHWPCPCYDKIERMPTLGTINPSGPGSLTSAGRLFPWCSSGGSGRVSDLPSLEVGGRGRRSLQELVWDVVLPEKVEKESNLSGPKGSNAGSGTAAVEVSVVGREGGLGQHT
jgi:hypothetical protein